jgi:hypothetical protein
MEQHRLKTNEQYDVDATAATGDGDSVADLYASFTLDLGELFWRSFEKSGDHSN